MNNLSNGHREHIEKQTEIKNIWFEHRETNITKKTGSKIIANTNERQYEQNIVEFLN